jgi:hypothetical protein
MWQANNGMAATRRRRVISGVGFFDSPHSQNPHAGNFAELHPVTGLKIVSGC